RDVLSEVVAVLEVELLLAALLDRHREDHSKVVCGVGNSGAELLVDENPRALARHLLGIARGAEPLEDQRLRILDTSDVLGCRRACDSQQVLLEGPTVIEGEEVDHAGSGATGLAAAATLTRASRDRASRGTGARGRRPPSAPTFLSRRRSPGAGSRSGARRRARSPRARPGARSGSDRP